jgi:hypothetical protein
LKTRLSARLFCTPKGTRRPNLFFLSLVPHSKINLCELIITDLVLDGSIETILRVGVLCHSRFPMANIFAVARAVFGSAIFKYDSKESFQPIENFFWTSFFISNRPELGIR